MTDEALESEQEPEGRAAFIFNQTAPGPTMPWSWAAKLLATAPTYWLATASPDGVPHSRPLWGVWRQNEFWFSSQNRSGGFLGANPRASVSLQAGEDVVMVEGSCARVIGVDGINVLVEGVRVKYNWETSAERGPHPHAVRAERARVPADPGAGVRLAGRDRLGVRDALGFPAVVNARG
ncbi:pyridoxamine 5'-phosphate oxidase family protein [Streptomyces lasalocidi]